MPLIHPPNGSVGCSFYETECAIAGALIDERRPWASEAAVWIGAVRPCDECRVQFAHAAADLRGVRLGSRERALLLKADAAAVVEITQPGSSRAESVAQRRAATSLSACGLISKAKSAARPNGRATISLTTFGRYVLDAFGRYLHAGQPIRWTRPARGVALPGREPSELIQATLARARAELQRTLGPLTSVLFRALAAPIAEQQKLEELVGQLEGKSRGLRHLLAASAASNVPFNPGNSAGEAV